MMQTLTDNINMHNRINQMNCGCCACKKLKKQLAARDMSVKEIDSFYRAYIKENPYYPTDLNLSRYKTCKCIQSQSCQLRKY